MRCDSLTRKTSLDDPQDVRSKRLCPDLNLRLVIPSIRHDSAHWGYPINLPTLRNAAPIREFGWKPRSYGRLLNTVSTSLPTINNGQYKRKTHDKPRFTRTFVGLTGFEPATPWRVQALFLVVAECLRKPSDSLMFTGNPAVRWLRLYAVTSSRSRAFLMGK
jgi:hypothetical protein